MPIPTIETVEATVRTLSADTVAINMPVDVYLQEAISLASWAEPDRAAFDAIGLDSAILDEIPVRVSVARKAESAWYAVRFSSSDDSRMRWDDKGAKAYEHRDDLLRVMRYAYRKDSQLLSRIAGIAEGTGHADMVQDLSDIVQLCRNNPAPLEKMKFDMGTLVTTETLAGEMSSLLGMLTTDRLSQSAAKIFRDQSIAYVKEAVDELRAAGQLVNAKIPDRLKGYSSAALRRRKTTKKSTADEKIAPTLIGD